MAGAATTPQSRRLERRFAALREAGRAGLVTYIMGGDPDADASQAILDGLPGAGADIIELGMAFSDPMADGPTIQAAGLRALKAGQTLPRTLAMLARFREADTETPVVLMGYYNPIHSFGVERFAHRGRRRRCRRTDHRRSAPRGSAGVDRASGPGRPAPDHADRAHDRRGPSPGRAGPMAAASSIMSRSPASPARARPTRPRWPPPWPA